MRRVFVLILLSVLTAIALPASAGAQTLPCIPIAGVTTCPGTPVEPEPDEKCAGRNDRPSVLGSARARAATLCLLNVERGKQGIAPLRTVGSLRAVAQRYARRMAVSNFFSHVGPSGDRLRDRVKRSSYLSGARSWRVGENIAWGSGRRSSPAEIVKGWMASPGHKRNMLDARFKHIGIGIVTGLPVRGAGTGGTYVTNFGAK